MRGGLRAELKCAGWAQISSPRRALVYICRYVHIYVVLHTSYYIYTHTRGIAYIVLHIL